MRRLIFTGSFLIFVCSYNLIGGVASNPFLRPSSQVPTPQLVPPPPPPPQKINPSLSKEVEFRGYFIYRGAPHFCVFNKKSNHGEWIRLNEKTFEEFQAHSFDLEKESLTLRFNGQEIVLTLEKSKVEYSNQSTPSNIPPPKANSLRSQNQSVSSSAPSVMPPRPSVRPKLPDWLLASRTSNNLPAASNSQSKSSFSGSSFPILPPRRVPNLTSGGSQAQVPGMSVQPTATQRGSLISSPSSMVSVSSNIPSYNEVDVSEIVSTQINEITTEEDLENLPPPPPPPNILPPGPPPNIVPSER